MCNLYIHYDEIENFLRLCTEFRKKKCLEDKNISRWKKIPLVFFKSNICDKGLRVQITKRKFRTYFYRSFLAETS